MGPSQTKERQCVLPTHTYKTADWITATIDWDAQGRSHQFSSLRRHRFHEIGSNEHGQEDRMNGATDSVLGPFLE
jgi:hypothetical protein